MTRRQYHVLQDQLLAQGSRAVADPAGAKILGHPIVIVDDDDGQPPIQLVPESRKPHSVFELTQAQAAIYEQIRERALRSLQFPAVQSGRRFYYGSPDYFRYINEDNS